MTFKEMSKIDTKMVQTFVSCVVCNKWNPSLVLMSEKNKQKDIANIVNLLLFFQHAYIIFEIVHQWNGCQSQEPCLFFLVLKNARKN